MFPYQFINYCKCSSPVVLSLSLVSPTIVTAAIMQLHSNLTFDICYIDVVSIQIFKSLIDINCLIIMYVASKLKSRIRSLHAYTHNYINLRTTPTNYELTTLVASNV